MGIVVGSTSVSFSDPAIAEAGEGAGRIVMEQSPELMPDGIGVRIYPSDPDRVVASVGTVKRGAVYPRDIRHEPVTLNKTSEITPRYPVSSGFQFMPLGDMFDPSGAVVSRPRMYWDADAGVARSAVPLVGAATIHYTTKYLSAVYSPAAYAETTEIGAVYAFRQGAVASLSIDLRIALDGEEDVEMYAVLSYGVVQGDQPGRISDVWELPPNWPEDNRYPGIAVPNAPDPDASVTIQRIHERAFINQRGRWRRIPVTVPREQPYAGVLSYRPAYTLRRGSPPDDDYARAFKDAPWERIYKVLSEKYPDIDLGEGG